MSAVATTRPSDAAPAPAPAHRPRLLRTAGLVALITLREILRRRGALALALARALPGRRSGGGGEARIAPAAPADAVASACAVAAASTEHFGTRAWIAAMPRG